MLGRSFFFLSNPEVGG